MQTNKALKGVIWSALERFSFQGVQFAVSIILARLLTPNDFGLVAIVLVFSTIFQTINESGLNTALVYKLDRDDIDYSTAFYANIAIGVASYLLLYFAAPFIADFYRNSSLISVMRILSLNLISATNKLSSISSDSTSFIVFPSSIKRYEFLERIHLMILIQNIQFHHLHSHDISED